MARFVPGDVRWLGGLLLGPLLWLGCMLDTRGEGAAPGSASSAGSSGSSPSDASGDWADASAGASGETGFPETGADDLQDAPLDESAAEACDPLQCADLGATCGDVGDGCGGTLHCGSCGPGLGCRANTCAPVVYVDASAQPGGQGASWADAFKTLDAALQAKPPAGTSIWVAKGIYTRAGPTEQVVVTMLPGVAMYGHFAGTELALEERKLDSPDETALDGEGVVRVVEAASSSLLDGFTVRKGVSPQGSGIHALNVQDFRVANCTVTGNTSSGDGGGIRVEAGSDVTISSTLVSSNTAGGTGAQGSFGGGLYLLASSSTIDRCVIKANTGGNGGGLGVQGGKVSVSATWFEDNHGTAYGQAGTGAAHNLSVDSSTTYTNCVFVHNASAAFGGAIYNSSASPRIVNCTFWGNTAALQLGLDVFDNPGSPFIVNSILASTGAGQHAISDYPSQGVQSAQVSYSDVVGESLGGTNLDIDPGFVNPGQGDFALGAGSPCIDAADPTAAPSTDQAGHVRDSKPDMGAFEYQTP